MILQPVTEERGLVGRAFDIDHDRQIAAQTHRIHVVKEECTMSAEQVLHIVLRGRKQHVDAGVLHQAVEPFGIEGYGRCGRSHTGEHGAVPLSGLWDGGPVRGSGQAPRGIAGWFA
jgi:hypothetical protein